MLLVISPAKNLDYETPASTELFTQPDFLNDSQELIEGLRQLAPQEISKLMKISDKLGVLNYDRYQAWQQPLSQPTAKQAMLAFNGDVYSGLQAESFTKTQLAFAQKHLRILSGLYGLLRPLDLMAPYRLEMGTRYANDRGKDLYAFWGEIITQALNAQLTAVKSDVLVNLASNEYFKSVKPKLLDARIITPIFKDKKGDQYKIISFYAKKARGLMCNYVISKGIKDVQQLKAFDVAGYQFNEAMSSDTDWVYTRDLAE